MKLMWGVPVVLTFLLTGCDAELDATVYTGDVYEVHKTGSNISVPATLMVPIQNADDCQKHQDRIIPVLRRYGKNVEFLNCKSISGKMSDAMFVRTDIEIFSGDVESPNFNGLGGIMVRKMFSDTSELMISFLRTDKVQQMEKELNDNSFSKVNLDDIKLTLVLSNDTRNDVFISIAGALVDGKPVPKGKPYKLERRDEIQIIPSDIRTQFLMSEGFISFAIISGEGAEPASWLLRDHNNLYESKQIDPKSL